MMVMMVMMRRRRKRRITVWLKHGSKFTLSFNSLAWILQRFSLSGTVCPGLQSRLLWGTWARCCWHLFPSHSTWCGVNHMDKWHQLPPGHSRYFLNSLLIPIYQTDEHQQAPLGFLASARHCAAVHLCMWGIWQLTGILEETGTPSKEFQIPWKTTETWSTFEKQLGFHVDWKPYAL